MECAAVPGASGTAFQVSGKGSKGVLLQGVRRSICFSSSPSAQAEPRVHSRALLERAGSALLSPSHPLRSLKAPPPAARHERGPSRSSSIVGRCCSGAAGYAEQWEEQWAEATGEYPAISGTPSVSSELAHRPPQRQTLPSSRLPSSTADAVAAQRQTWAWPRIVLLTSAALCVAAVALLLVPQSVFASGSHAAAAAAVSSSSSTASSAAGVVGSAGAAGTAGVAGVGEATIAKLSIGIKIAEWLRGHLGWILADEAIVVLVAALPVVELRGAIPVAFWLGMSAAKAFWLSVLGNMIPVPFILLYLGSVRALVASRSERLRRAIDWFLDYTRSKAAPIEEFKFLGIMLFVGVPLPGTGAWSGAICSYLLNISFWEALFANFFGVLIAGGVVCAMCLSGGRGAAFLALNLFLLSGGMWTLVRAGIKVAKAVGHKGTP